MAKVEVRKEPGESLLVEKEITVFSVSKMRRKLFRNSAKGGESYSVMHLEPVLIPDAFRKERVCKFATRGISTTLM